MKSLWFSLALVLLAACSSAKLNQETFRDEAEAFCRAHSIGYWEESGHMKELYALGPMEKQIRLIKEIRSTINSEEMERVIYEEAQTLSADEFYPYLQDELPKLTGRPFECPEINAFYLSQ